MQFQAMPSLGRVFSMVTHTRISAQFEFQGRCHLVSLKSVATLGSHFYTIEGEEMPDLLPGNFIDVCVYGPEGMSKVAGTIRWIRTMGDWYSLGVEFAEIAPALQEHLLQMQENQSEAF
jgi:hypothetical protein